MSAPVFKEPMLAHDFKKPECAAKIIFPAMAQRKIDGWRCFATDICTDCSETHVGDFKLLSRNGKPLLKLNHILKDLEDCFVMCECECPTITLDGELYSDRLTFQQLSALLQKKTITNAKAYESIFYVVFDVIMEGSNVKRQEWLTAFFAANSFKHIKLLPKVARITEANAQSVAVFAIKQRAFSAALNKVLGLVSE
jgi:ATP-dependent DNA ligase